MSLLGGALLGGIFGGPRKMILVSEYEYEDLKEKAEKWEKAHPRKKLPRYRRRRTRRHK